MKFAKTTLFLFLLWTGFKNAWAQHPNYPLWSPIYQILDRNEIKGAYNLLNIQVKPFYTNKLQCKINNNNLYIATENGLYDFYKCINKSDTSGLDSIKNTISNKGNIMKFSYLYKNKRDLLALSKYGNKYFNIQVNPIFSFQGGGESPSKKHAFKKNTRGVEVKGSVKGKLGFYTHMTENQVWMNTYDSIYRQDFGFFNGFGFNKNFKTGGVDYINATGYITFSALERIHFTFGQSRTHIGNGIRSVIWDGTTPTTTHLKINTDLGPIQYFNFFSKGVSDNFLPGNVAVSPKYMAYHRIGLDLGRKINLGLSETIIFNNQTASGLSGYKIDYLNPLIFYRSVEQGLGSADNAMMALDWKWNFLKQFQFYGQFVLDEFNLNYFKQNTGWWGNKYAAQAGLKYIDVASINGLDFQYEANMAKPFTYSHYNPNLSFTHFNQPIGHYLGANFMEHIFKLRYQINQKMWIESTTDLYNQGQDSIHSKINYGGNIRLDNDTRSSEFGHSFLQGNKTKGFNTNIQFTYMPFHNLFIDLKVGKSSRFSVEKTREFNFNYLLFGIRMNTGFGNTQ